MKTRIYHLSALLLLSACAAKFQPCDVNVIPAPLDVEYGRGSLDVRGAGYWICPDLDTSSDSAVVSFFDRLGAACTIPSVRLPEEAGSVFRFRHDSGLAPESYIIDVGRRSVEVSSSSFRGVLYALETLRQLLPAEIYSGFPDASAAWSLPRVRIEDRPRFRYRGMHLDAARHFWDVDQVKRYLDIMAIHKMNVFHWHLSDDQGWRVEIRKYPRLTEVGSKRRHTAIGRGWSDIEYDGVPYGGYYTQEQIREVVSYAASKGISVIPEIDLPGHMLAAIASYPELGCTGGPYEVWGRWGISSDVLCVGREATFTFIEGVLDEIMELFPSECIHIGGDECPKVRWHECPDCRAHMEALGLNPDEKESADLLQGYVTDRVQAFVKSRGRRIIGWDEILAGDVDTSAVIMSWRGTDGGIAASEAGHDVIMTPTTYCYFDYYQSRRIQEEPFSIGGYVSVEKVYSFEPFTLEMTQEQKDHILGVQANLWTEYISDPDHLYYMLLPRMSALSEVQWCAEGKRDYQGFLNRMGRMKNIYGMLGYGYGKHIFEVTPVIGVDVETGCPVVELNTQGDAPMYYTLDGSLPTVSSTRYTTPVTVRDGEVFKAVVDRDDMKTKVFSQSFIRHKATGRSVRMNTEPDPMHSAGLPGSLVNGVADKGDEAGGWEWMAWRGAPVDVVIDMNGETFGRVSVRALVSKWEDLYPPVGMTAYVSDDGETFTELAALALPQDIAGVPDGVNKYELTFPETSARFLRLVMETVEEMPLWSERPGRPAYLFIDEIIVE